jgi:hypothetical protein
VAESEASLRVQDGDTAFASCCAVRPKKGRQKFQAESRMFMKEVMKREMAEE